MKYFFVLPEVAGGLGEHSVLDTSVRPSIVRRLHYQMEGWLGDAILETFPVFIVTEEAKNALLESGLSGMAFDEVEVTLSDRFRELYPGRMIPSFAWLKPGQAGEGDFGVAVDGRLVVSERALDLLKRLGISNALVEPFVRTVH